MKIFKFGGNSVGSASTLLNIKNIVESQQGSVVVVVSALGGITDQLLLTAKTAAAGKGRYGNLYNKIRKRHLDLIEELPLKQDAKARLEAGIKDMLDRLGDLFHGISLLHILSERTSDEVVSYGERMSSLIVSALLEDAELFDSLKLIRTVRRNGKDVPDFQKTNLLIKEAFAGFDSTRRIAVMPGFISTDARTGCTTTLGRGGSDYTASIVAAALDAEVLEIWTDVDGFMTADPRVIKTSYVISELSYKEAMELCNFGAKVIYPPTLYPVRAKGIPIKVKNTFNPSAPGTVIKESCTRSDKPITGISSISDTSLLTLSAGSLVDVIGVDGRIFSSLAKNGISVFMICQASSETGISIGVKSEDAPLAQKLLNQEFAHEIKMGSIDPVKVISGLSTIAVVGENMRNSAGVAGKLFSTLGRNGISVIACTQDSNETNISFVVESKSLRKSLNVIHDSFFLSEYQELNVFICGIGTVGGKLIEQIAQQQEKLMKERNLKINIVGIARSTKGIFDRNGIDLASYKEQLKEGMPLDAGKLKEEVIGMNIFNSVFVDCTASEEVSKLYADLLDHSISVVAANKIAASGDYDKYKELKDIARKRNVKFLFETNVGAGLPIIKTINDLVNSGDKIEKIEAVLSGTLNFIFNTISADIPFSETVRMAKEQGFSEPDPRIDLCGKDVMRKLVILSREAGYKVSLEDVEANLFIPKEFFDCSMDEFWKKLPSLDEEFESRRKELEKSRMQWRFVARMEDGKFSVSLEKVKELHSFYVLDGSNNIVLLTTERYHRHPMLIQGYGAGADVTAAGVFADIMRVANI